MRASRDWFGGTEKLCQNRSNYDVTLTLQAREWAKAKFGGDRHEVAGHSQRILSKLPCKLSTRVVRTYASEWANLLDMRLTPTERNCLLG
jgi:hypothetical protein